VKIFPQHELTEKQLRIVEGCTKGGMIVAEAFSAASNGDELTEKQLRIVERCTEGGMKKARVVREAWRAADNGEPLTDAQLRIIKKAMESWKNKLEALESQSNWMDGVRVVTAEFPDVKSWYRRHVVVMTSGEDLSFCIAS